MRSRLARSTVVFIFTCIFFAGPFSPPAEAGKLRMARAFAVKAKGVLIEMRNRFLYVYDPKLLHANALKSSNMARGAIVPSKGLKDKEMFEAMTFRSGRRGQNLTRELLKEAQMQQEVYYIGLPERLEDLEPLVVLQTKRKGGKRLRLDTEDQIKSVFEQCRDLGSIEQWFECLAALASPA